MTDASRGEGSPDGGRLVFVYNADSGLLNAAKDIWHRVTSPLTYPCALCKLTYGTTRMDRRWRQFVESLDVPVEFLHRDELASRTDIDAAGVELPVGLLVWDGSTQAVVTAAEMRNAATLDDLISLVTAIPGVHS
ncbi:hypothetical protein BH24ACT6_BH24ACT6_04930 [soil metagenome]